MFTGRGLQQHMMAHACMNMVMCVLLLSCASVSDFVVLLSTSTNCIKRLFLEDRSSVEPN